jgi:hypothetical protein
VPWRLQRWQKRLVSCSCASDQAGWKEVRSQRLQVSVQVLLSLLPSPQ